MDDRKDFETERQRLIEEMTASDELRHLGIQYLQKSIDHRLPYTVTWLGVPIIQFHQDIVALQEIVWQVKPKVIIETGVARGGSAIFFASLLHLIDEGGIVIGIDVDIRDHNRATIEEHKMASRIKLIEGSSIDPDIVSDVAERVGENAPVLVVLDSMHTHDHVLQELNQYSAMVTKGSYIVVGDTMIEDMPSGYYKDRPWDVGNSPKTALYAFLEGNDNFVIDKTIAGKSIATCNHDGYLKRVR